MFLHYFYEHKTGGLLWPSSDFTRGPKQTSLFYARKNSVKTLLAHEYAYKASSIYILQGGWCL